MEEWAKTGEQIDFIASLRPDLLTVGFQFNQPYHVATVNNMRIVLETETGVKIDLDDGYDIFEINDGGLVGRTSGGILGEAFKGSIKADIFNTSKDLLDSIIVTVETVEIAVKVNSTTSRIEFIAIKKDILVPETNNVLNLVIRLVFTIRPKGPDDDPDTPDNSPIWDFNFEQSAYTTIAFCIKSVESILK